MDTVISISDHVMRLEKVRDGVEGEQFPFELEVIDMGIDEDGDPITTCVVHHLEDKQDVRPKAKLSDSEKIATDSLREAIADVGESLPATSAIPIGIRGVNVESWRNSFFRRYAEDRSDEATKKAFQRAKAGLLAKALVGAVAPWVWIR
jgi:hypothetical protein